MPILPPGTLAKCEICNTQFNLMTKEERETYSRENGGYDFLSGICPTCGMHYGSTYNWNVTESDKMKPKKEFMLKAELKLLNNELKDISGELGPAILEQGKHGIRVCVLLKKADEIRDRQSELMEKLG